MKNIIKISLVIIGTLVGAGFASGREIYTFFFIYGKLGIVGILISCFIISYIIYKVLYICNKNKINTYSDFCDFLSNSFNDNNLIKFNNKIISTWLNNVVNIFLLITYFVMISGFSSFMKQEFNANGFISSGIIILLCYFVFLKNVEGLVRLSNYLIPIVIIFIIFISMKNINFIENYNNIFGFTMLENTGDISVSNIWKAFYNSILYGCYNCIIMIPVIITLKNQINNRKNIKYISFFSFLIINLLSISIFNLLLQGNELIFKLEMPIITITSKLGKIYKLIYLMIIGISIFTTAVSSGCGFLNNCSKNRKSFKINLLFISFFAIFLSQISFSFFVNLLYPVLGIVGFAEVLMIAFL